MVVVPMRKVCMWEISTGLPKLTAYGGLCNLRGIRTRFPERISASRVVRGKKASLENANTEPQLLAATLLNKMTVCGSFKLKRCRSIAKITDC